MNNESHLDAKVCSEIRPAFAERNIPVAFATDENYLPYVKVLLRSIVANTKWNLDFLILGNHLSEAAQAALKESFAQCENVSIRFIDVVNLVAGTAVEGFKFSWGHFTVATFYRLFLPQLFPCYEKLIYIDVDTVVCGDIAELYSTDIGDNLFCAAIDDGIALWAETWPQYAQWLEMNSFSAKDLESYVNVGVLLMNLKAFREASLLDRLLSTALGADKYMGYYDQDALNFVCRGRIKIIDASWDIMTGPCKEVFQKQLSSMKEAPHLYHFTGLYKPWKDPSYLYSNVWWRYIDIEDGIALWRKIFNVSEDKTSGDGIAVSVIIPIYNAEKYIKQMLISLAAQTLRNIEIICVDDGSTDGSKAVCEEFAAFDSRFRVITQKNSGAAIARNRGIDEAKGRWLFFADADDFCKPEMLEEMVAEGDKKNADVVVAEWGSFDSKTGLKTDVKFPAEYAKLQGKVNCHTEGINIFSQTNFAPWNKLYRSDFIKANGIIYHQISPGDDAFFVISSMLKADNLALLAKPYYYYRYNNSESQTGKLESRVESWLNSLLEVKALLVNESEKLQTQFVSDVMRQACDNLLSLKTMKGQLDVLDVIRGEGFKKLSFPSTEKDKLDLVGIYRVCFDMAHSGCDLIDLFRAHANTLSDRLKTAWDNYGAAKEKLTKAWADRDVLREKLNNAWETNKVNKSRLQSVNDEIKELKTKLKKREASLKKREREIRSLKSSASYRAGRLLTWPVRKVFSVGKRLVKKGD